MDPSVETIAVDFGGGITVVARSGRDSCTTISMSGWSREAVQSGTGAVHIIPSLIHYRDNRRPLIGEEVIAAGVSGAESTGRWMLGYILEGSPARIPAGDGRTISHAAAAAEFLSAVLTRAGFCRAPRFVCTFPAGAPPAFRDRLLSALPPSGAAATVLVDHLTAAVTGYGVQAADGDMFLFVHGGSTELRVMAASYRPENAGPVPWQVRAETSLDDAGCSAIDSAVTDAILRRHRFYPADRRTMRIRPLLLHEVTRARETTGDGSVPVHVADPRGGPALDETLGAEIVRGIMEAAGIPERVRAAISRVCERAGCDSRDETGLRGVILTGGGCLLPAIRALVREQCPGTEIHDARPLDAAAIGAALHVPVHKAGNRVQNDYALCYWDPATAGYCYRFLVYGGTRCPSAGQVARVVICAAYEGQTHLGIPLCEIARDAAGPAAIELVGAGDGQLVIAAPSRQHQPGTRPLPVNGKAPTLLVADPPAHEGEPRFELTFSLDRERNLRVTARDVRTGTFVLQDRTVWQLT